MRNIKKKYKSPRMAWDTAQIGEQKKILSEYGLKNKREFLRTMEILRNFRKRARELAAKANETEKKRLLGKLEKFGILESGKGLDDVLALTVRNVLERRLQTILFRKGIASSVKQARQFIVHGKIGVCSRKVNIPSYLVPLEEESKISMKANPGQKKKAEEPKSQGVSEAANGQ